MFNIKKLFFVLLVLTLFFCMQVSLIAKDVLKIYTVIDPERAKLYFEAFTKDTKIDVEFERLSSGDTLNRLKDEAGSPKVSVWFGGSSIEHITAKKNGYTTPYQSPSADYLKNNLTLRDNDWYWYGYSFGAIAIICNINYFQQNKLKYPAVWDDLLKPEYKNTISLSFPYSSGTSLTFLATLIMLRNEDKAFEYWKKFDVNVHHYNKSGPACIEEVGKGDVAIGIAFSQDIITKGIAKGYPIKMIFPNDGTGYEIGCISIIKGAPLQDAAKKFVDWSLSKKGQDQLKLVYSLPLNPKAEVPPGAVKASQIKLAKFDAEWVGENNARLKEKWKTIIGK